MYRALLVSLSAVDEAMLSPTMIKGCYERQIPTSQRTENGTNLESVRIEFNDPIRINDSVYTNVTLTNPRELEGYATWKGVLEAEGTFCRATSFALHRRTMTAGAGAGAGTILAAGTSTGIHGGTVNKPKNRGGRPKGSKATTVKTAA